MADGAVERIFVRPGTGTLQQPAHSDTRTAVGAAESVGVETDTARFLVELARLLHVSGASAGRLEDAVRNAGEQLRVDTTVFSTPTSVVMGFGHDGQQRVSLLRVQPGDIDLEQLVDVDAVATAVAEGTLTPREGLAALIRIRRRKARYGFWSTLGCVALASAGVGRFFGGGWDEIAASAFVSVWVGLMFLTVSRTARGSRLVDLLAGLISGFLSVAIARCIVPADHVIVALGGLILLVPGLTITLSVSELSSRNFVSGSSRLMGGAMVVVVLAFGTAIGKGLGGYLPDSPLMDDWGAAGLRAWTVWPTLVLSALCFVVLFRAKPRDALPITLAAAIGYGVSSWVGGLSGPEFGAFAGAFALALFGNVWSRWKNQPSGVAIIPGLLLLVPGSLGVRGVSALMAEDVMSGAQATFGVVVIAVGIVAGLLSAHAVWPSRKAV